MAAVYGVIDSVSLKDIGVAVFIPCFSSSFGDYGWCRNNAKRVCDIVFGRVAWRMTTRCLHLTMKYLLQIFS